MSTAIPHTVRALAVVLGAAIALGTTATAATTSRWTQITKAHSGSLSNLGLARGKDGTLHVLWAGPGKAPFTSILDTAVAPSGAVGGAKPVLSGWNSVQRPAAVAAPDGTIRVLVSGQKVLATNDPFAGLNAIVGPGSWTLGAQAFGRFQITVPSNADVGVGVLRSGELVSVWRTARALLFQTGVDAATQPRDITPQGLGEAPVLAVDRGSGDAVVAYRDVASGIAAFRRLLPALGPPTPMSRGKVNAPSIAARAGGGVFSAYPPDAGHVVLLRFGGRARVVPVPKGAIALTAGVAAGPEGRLWVFYGDTKTIYVTRTSKATGAFEPVQRFQAPPRTVQLFRLEGEGSAGPLDLFAAVTVDGGTKDGSYHVRVYPALSLRIGKTAAGSGKVRVTVHVTDAGDAVAGARVTGLPGGPKTTGAGGTIRVTLAAGRKLALTAAKPGYVSATGKGAS